MNVRGGDRGACSPELNPSQTSGHEVPPLRLVFFMFFFKNNFRVFRFISVYFRCKYLASCGVLLAEELFGTGEVVGGIDADGFDVGFGHTDAVAVL